MRKLLALLLGLFAVTVSAQVVPNLDWIKYYSYHSGIRNHASTIDANNNVFVTGSVDGTSGQDLVVLKYDSLGTLLWSDVYDNGGNDEGRVDKI